MATILADYRSEFQGVVLTVKILKVLFNSVAWIHVPLPCILTLRLKYHRTSAIHSSYIPGHPFGVAFFWDFSGDIALLSGLSWSAISSPDMGASCES
ncbi:hypothetical protein ACH7BS_24470 [Klebsiella aerogenes]|uniref:hypothetical protein n=1 Tax=Klebsiella aerogenes TaxID=548 RepID=UPI00378A2597